MQWYVVKDKANDESSKTQSRTVQLFPDGKRQLQLLSSRRSSEAFRLSELLSSLHFAFHNVVLLLSQTVFTSSKNTFCVLSVLSRALFFSILFFFLFILQSLYSLSIYLSIFFSQFFRIPKFVMGKKEIKS